MLNITTRVKADNTEEDAISYAYLIISALVAVTLLQLRDPAKNVKALSYCRQAAY